MRFGGEKLTTLRDLRIRANATQEQVARTCNVSQGAVSRWEKGENPPLRKYHPYLRRALRCTKDELQEALRS